MWNSYRIFSIGIDYGVGVLRVNLERHGFVMFEDNLKERYELAVERIKGIKIECERAECSLSGDVSCYFKKVSSFLEQCIGLSEWIEKGGHKKESLEKLEAVNHQMYEDILVCNYDKSYANPAYAVSIFGMEIGQLLSFLYVELRSILVMTFEGRMGEITSLFELFIEIYCYFLDESSSNEHLLYQGLKDIIYWYISDYSDEYIEYRVREQIDPSFDFATNIIMNEDLSDVRYLYQFGEYITENEIKTATYLNSLSEEKIQAMAHTFTEGYRKGFELGNKDITKKKTVNIRYCLGFERLVRAEIRQFREMGLETTVYRAAVNTINKRMHIKVGYYATSPNRQMEYDHRFDSALYMDSAFIERKLGALKLAYEKYADLAGVFGGPAVMEVFGETPFEPMDKPENMQFSEKQQKLSVRYDNEASAIVNQYIKGEERSFTIIAYPIPEIGEKFEQIFDEVVKINTLDYEVYKEIQQHIIDVLDGADYVEIKGCGRNMTNMKVRLMPIQNPEKETIFENCVADVNIPLGEVFTSPVLEGTQGVLHVSKVYLNDLLFKELKIYFKDGMITDYTCENFAEEEKNKVFFKENVLYNHTSLPLGEFAIGTNTTAYVMANQYDIVSKLPILIVEKMGPHFAVGDTCYSRAEDVTVYNPDGKEIISRDNEVSILRKTQPDKAYFNCHTDITIPYDEIGRISAVKSNGEQIDIIRDGRFVLQGCEELNKPFDDCGKTK